MNQKPKWQRWLFLIGSWLIVSLGNPSLVPVLGLLSATIGYALFWVQLVEEESAKKRFWVSFIWMTGIHLVQMSWFLAHPFWYILLVYGLVSAVWGVQFGLIGIFVKRQRLQSVWNLLGLSGAWTLMEWSRLYMLSGYSWNPTGLALAGTTMTMQMAAIGGVFALTFFIFFTNLLAVRSWLYPTKIRWITWGCFALFPFVFGFIHMTYHDRQLQAQGNQETPVLLVQTSFPVEESIPFQSQRDAIDFVFWEWQTIFSLIEPYYGQNASLVVLPEYVVPFRTFYPLFRYEDLEQLITKWFGSEAAAKMPKLTAHLAMEVDGLDGPVWMINNAYFAQTIANLYDANVVIGLEDEDYLPDGEKRFVSSAFIFYPQKQAGDFRLGRYDKRVLVPMGEYIPSEFVKDLCATYGITGSFTCGTTAKVFPTQAGNVSLSVCYEETFGGIMCEAKPIGAEMLVNITNDGWYPHSNLPSQHLEHARLRTVEMGVPLVRSCNTGVTCAIDSLGRTISYLSNSEGDVEEIAASLHVDVPTYHYPTLYSVFGDRGIVGLSFACMGIALLLNFSCLLRKSSL